MMEVIASTLYKALPNALWECTKGSADYHPVRTGTGGDFKYYDPWMRRNSDAHTAKSRAVTTRVVPDVVPIP